MAHLIVEKILVAVDFSEHSDIALEQAVQIASQGQDVELVLLWVDTRESSSEELVHGDMLGNVPLDIVASSEVPTQTPHELDEIADRVTQRGVRVSTRVESGHPDEVIVEVARRIGAALVVIGTRGLTGFKRFLLGSVAEKVVRTCLCNVLVVRREPATFSRILVATDFSAASEHALQLALALAAPNARIDIVHAWQYPPGVRGVNSPDPNGPLAEVRDQMLRRLERLGGALVKRYQGHERTVAFETIFGPAAKVLHERLEEEDYQLVAMGTHGHRGFRRFLLGSVAEATVRHAPCSVLVTHDLGQQDEDASDD